MASQKPPDLDENLNPIKPPDLDANGKPIQATTAPVVQPAPVKSAPISTPKPQEEGFLTRAYRAVFEPPKFVTETARNIATDISTPRLQNERMQIADPYAEGEAVKGLLGGLVEGVGSLISPANLLTMGRGRLATIAARAFGAPQIAHGAYELSQGNYLPAAADIGFGTLGVSAQIPRSKVGERLLNLHGQDLQRGIPTLPKTPVDILGGSDITPPSGGAPVFNPRATTGMTGNLQSVAEGAKKPKVRIDAEGNVINTETGEQFEMPSAARTETGGIKIGADTESLGKILGQSLYSKNIAVSATKELIQNSLDAIKGLGSEGRIDVKFTRKVGNDAVIEVSDNGPGMTREQVETVLTDLGSSGKSADEDIGGFGLAKASFLLGGKHVSVQTRTIDPITGKLNIVEFSGTPDELLQGIQLNESSDVDFLNQIDQLDTIFGVPKPKDLRQKLEADPNLKKTGTTIRVTVPENSSFYEANDFVNKLQKFSNYEGTISFDRHGSGYIVDIPERIQGDVIAEIPGASGDTKLIVPKNAVKRERGALDLILTNRGMYQGTMRHYLDKNTPDIPDSIIVDISSHVPVKHEDYPFTANREALRGSVFDAVKKYIDDNLVNPALGRYRNDLIDMYANLPMRGQMGSIAFDPSGRLTSSELDVMMNHPVMKSLYDELYNIMDTALTSMAKDFNKEQLEKLGFIFTEKLRGIHIPNPQGGKSAILINPLQLMRDRTPDQAAAGWIHTILHELTHMNVGEHSESFTIALADVHEKFGGSNAYQATERFKQVVSDLTGGYNPETQKLLRKYIISRGREGVDDNLLTRTGIGSEDTGGSEGGISQFINSLGKGAVRIRLKKTTPEIVKELIRRGYEPGGIGPDGLPYMVKNGRPQLLQELPLSEPEKMSFGQELYNLARGSTTIWDISAPFRQGNPLFGTKNWFKAWFPMVKALGDKGAYDFLIADIKSHPYFKEDFDVVFSNGQWRRKRIPSIAEKAGLAITDLKNITNREENMMSTWAEKIPGAKASNRAYSVFLNKLRADTFRDLMNDAQKIYNEAITSGSARPGLRRQNYTPEEAEALNPLTNEVLAKSIADYVNTATGRGPLRTHRPSLSGRLVETSLEQNAKRLSQIFFSPRLVASRVRMLNPATYIAADPFTRKQYMKSAIYSAAAWMTMLGLGKMAGAEVVLDPRNADFGKAKFGNTRLDPAGGFQQFLVLFARLASGKTIESTNPNRIREFGQGYQAPTRYKTAERFAANKLHPVAKFGYDLWDASEYKPVQMGDRILQMYVPLIVQDVMELAKEDPNLLPLLIPTAAGMGTQTYEKGEMKSFAIPKELDYTWEGGSMF